VDKKSSPKTRTGIVQNSCLALIRFWSTSNVDYTILLFNELVRLYCFIYFKT